MVKIIRLGVDESMAVPIFEMGGIEFKTTEWTGWYDENNNIIWLKSFAGFKVLFHEILHYLTDKFMPFVKLRNIIHFAVIDRHPREMWFIGQIKVW